MRGTAQQREAARVGEGDAGFVGIGTVHEWFDDVDAENLVAHAVPLKDLPAAHLRMLDPDEAAGIKVSIEAGADLRRQIVADQATSAGVSPARAMP